MIASLYDNHVSHGSEGIPGRDARDHRVSTTQISYKTLLMSRLGSHLRPVYWWPKLELDSRTALMMMKGALAPTITIAMYVFNRD